MNQDFPDPYNSMYPFMSLVNFTMLYPQSNKTIDKPFTLIIATSAYFRLSNVLKFYLNWNNFLVVSYENLMIEINPNLKICSTQKFPYFIIGIV